MTESKDRRKTGQSEMDSSNDDERKLRRLILDQEWDQVRKLCSDDPKVVMTQDNEGRTPLHHVCYVPSAPADVVDMIASVWPEAISTSDWKWGDTPLHTACRNSQRTSSVVFALLRYCGEEGVLATNRLGSTALHSACSSNGMLAVCQALVQANPLILTKLGHQGESALDALWQLYVQSIPGHLAVAAILKGCKEPGEGHFDRFWNKVKYLSLKRYQLMESCPDSVNSADPDASYLAHALLQWNAPIRLFHIALTIEHSIANAVDRFGNTPLHILVERRPFAFKDREAIVALLAVSHQPAAVFNEDGFSPLTLAIIHKLSWDEGLEEIILAEPSLLQQRDPRYDLYPFLLAATCGGRAAIDTTYRLLSAQPDLVDSTVTD
jgi:ankyrin repeat protein